jgi:hypothetical protein
MFTVQAVQPVPDGPAGLLLQSRTRLQTTSLPRQEIQVWYQQQTSLPVKVVQTSRELVPLEAAEYEILKHTPGNESRLLVINGQYCLIKEHTDVFQYQQVSHVNNQPLPVQLSDRITRDATGALQPAAAFKDYSLTLF